MTATMRTARFLILKATIGLVVACTVVFAGCSGETGSATPAKQQMAEAIAKESELGKAKVGKKFGPPPKSIKGKVLNKTADESN